MTPASAVAAVFALLAAIGCGYALAAAWTLRAYARRKGAPAATAAPSVTILKPLHGDEPGLFDTLSGFCAQRYPGPVQVVFGVADAGDPAAAVARAVIAAHPGLAADLVVDGRRHGANGKVSNLANMARAIRHEVVVLADSDMVVAPDYLARVVGALSEPGVGAVTCLYRGLAVPGFWSRMAVLGIDHHFLPNAVFGLTLGLAEPCFGSTIALSRDTLGRIGGFEAFKDVLADDNAMGQAVRRLGLRVAVPARPVLGHVCAATGFKAVFRQDLRWSRTIRAVDPAGFAGSIVTNPLPLATIALVSGGFGPIPAVILTAALASRLALQVQGSRLTGARAGVWLGPLRDFLSFAVFLASFWPGSLDWRGHAFAVRADGTMASHDQTGR